jgi:dephospho-CoA kinase
MIRIALTGVFGSGKSTVAKILKDEGATVISCDAFVKRLLSTSAIKAEIRAAFGQAFFTRTGAVDREKLAALVFRARSARKKLEKIIHPRVFEWIQKTLDRFSGTCKMIVVEIPLLFETKSENQFDEIITVSTSPDIIRKRLSKKFSVYEINARLRSQKPLKEKEALSNYVVDNSSSVFQTKKQVRSIVADIRRRYGLCQKKSMN